MSTRRRLSVVELRDPSTEMELEELVRAVLPLVSRLPLEQRNAIELRFLHGLTVSQVAERTGRSGTSIKRDTARGLSNLKVEAEALVTPHNDRPKLSIARFECVSSSKNWTPSQTETPTALAQEI